MSENEKIREQLSAYLDGELNEADRRRVEQALAGDETLSAELETLRATRDLVHSLPRAEAPEGFVDRVLAQAERRRLVGGPETAARPDPWRAVRWVAAAAVVLIAVGVGTIVTIDLWSHSIEDRIAATTDQSSPPDGRHVATPESTEKDLEHARHVDRTDSLDTGLESKKGGISRGKGGGGHDEFAMKKARPVPKKPGAGKKNGEGFFVAGEIGKSYGGVSNEVIYTADLDDTRRDVEKVLLANCITLGEPVDTPGGEVVPEGTAVKKDKEVFKKQSEDAKSRRGWREMAANRYQTNLVTKRQVQYVVNVEPARKAKVLAALRQLRASQRVTQMSASLSPQQDSAIVPGPAARPKPSDVGKEAQKLEKRANRDIPTAEVATKQAPAGGQHGTLNGREPDEPGKVGEVAKGGPKLADKAKQKEAGQSKSGLSEDESKPTRDKSRIARKGPVTAATQLAKRQPRTLPVMKALKPKVEQVGLTTTQVLARRLKYETLLITLNYRSLVEDRRLRDRLQRATRTTAASQAVDSKAKEAATSKKAAK